MSTSRPRLPESAPVEDDGAPEWVVTYGDLMSLLLTFFILVLSFADMEAERYQAFSGAMMEAAGVLEIEPSPSRPVGRKIIFSGFEARYDARSVLQGAVAAREQVVERAPEGEIDIEVFDDYRGVVVAVGQDGLFEAGKVDLRPAMYAFMDELLTLAGRNSAVLQVETHTDGTPTTNTAYPSNDHLSAARSLSIVRYLDNRAEPVLGLPLAPERLVAVPWGDHRPRGPAVGEADRRRNRRVEFVFQAAAPLR